MRECVSQVRSASPNAGEDIHEVGVDLGDVGTTILIKQKSSVNWP